ncbi:Peptide deformylase [hydrothermal vent metagenome]|uniref:Peptide deformylase n=1 Tax=hydrothermal vent metagenome TaxID=652676 RepID=A0A1W1CKP5_9ZZZZ
MLIDTHCHLDKPRYKRVMRELLHDAQEHRVKGILIPATQQKSLDYAQILAQSYAGVFYAVGFHPKYADKFELSVLEQYVEDKRCIAIGEFGLDYARLSRDEAIRQPIIENQKEVLVAHLEFAVKHQKPVIIHLRDKHIYLENGTTAYDDFLEIVQPYLGRLVGGVIHALNFDRDDYLDLVKHNFYFGIGGQLTYDIEGLTTFVKKAPLDRLLFETDAPWLTPKARKKGMKNVVNKPAYMVDVLEELSSILEIDSLKLEQSVYENTLKLFPQFKECKDEVGYSVGRVRSVAQLGAEVIRKVATKVDDIESKETQELIDDLILTCIDSQGMGIASPQISQSKRIFIMASTPNSRYPNAPKMKPKAIINPEIISYSDELEKDWEGCLSLPNVRATVPRSKRIEVRYLTRDGKEVEEVLEGFLARIFQHEFDHLNGKVFIDRVESSLDIVMEREYRKMIYGKKK